jgi:hypothetical protein
MSQHREHMSRHKEEPNNGRQSVSTLDMPMWANHSAACPPHNNQLDQLERPDACYRARAGFMPGAVVSPQPFLQFFTLLVIKY